MDAQLREFGYKTNEEETQKGWTRPAGVGMAAGAAAGAAYGGKKLRNAVINRAGAVDDYGNLVARKGMYGDAAKQVARGGLSNVADRADAVGEKMRGKVWKAGPGATGRGIQVLKKGEELAGGLAGKIRKVSKMFSAGQVEAIAHLAERIAVLELEAEEEGLTEFADTEQRSPYGVALAGAAGGNYISSVGAVRAQGRFKEAGHVYRKRDAFKDSLKGSGVGAGTSVGLLGAGLGGAAALGALAGKRKLPKGMLRKVGVKAGKAVRSITKDGRKLAAAGQAAGLAGAGAGFYAQGKFADKRLAKRQAEA